MSDDDEVIPIGEAVRSMEWLGRRLEETREERDRYRDWFERLNAATSEYIARVTTEKADTAEALADLRAKVDRMANARTRKRQLTAGEKRAEALSRYAAGEPVKVIAADLRRTERWVYAVIPENMKRRR